MEFIDFNSLYNSNSEMRPFSGPGDGSQIDVSKSFIPSHHQPYSSHNSSFQQNYNGTYHSGVSHYRGHSRGVSSHVDKHHFLPSSALLQQETQISIQRLRKSELLGIVFIGLLSNHLAYAPRYIERLFLCDPSPPTSFPNQIPLPSYLLNIINRTRINTCTLVAAFFYLDRLKQIHPRCKGSPGSGHRLFLAAIVLAAKYLYDDTFDNTAWATVSSGLFELEQVNHMEREMLSFLDFKLFIKAHEWYHFIEKLCNEMAPPPPPDLYQGQQQRQQTLSFSPSMTLPNRSRNNSRSISRQASFSKQDTSSWSGRAPSFSRQDSSSTIIGSHDPYLNAPSHRQGWVGPPTSQNPNANSWLRPEDFTANQ